MCPLRVDEVLVFITHHQKHKASELLWGVQRFKGVRLTSQVKSMTVFEMIEQKRRQYIPVVQKHICTVHLCCDMYIVKILLQSKDVIGFPNDYERQDVDIVRQCV